MDIGEDLRIPHQISNRFLTDNSDSYNNNKNSNYQLK